MYTTYTNKIYDRHSIRLNRYDYSQTGTYFITILAYKRQFLFGEIIDDKIKLNKLGKIVKSCWLQIPQYNPRTSLDEYVIMPNHIHGIILIPKDLVRAQETEPRPKLLEAGAQSLEPLPNNACIGIQHNKFQKIIPKSIGSIIREFKASVTKWSRDNNLDYTVWHRNYYEHIVRDEGDLFRINEYILNNPPKWTEDQGRPLYAPYRN